MNQPAHIEARCPACGRKMLPVSSARVNAGAGPVAKELKALRVKRGLSQNAVAKKSGFSKVTIGLWERGIHIPTKFNMQCWKDALGYEHG